MREVALDRQVLIDHADRSVADLTLIAVAVALAGRAGIVVVRRRAAAQRRKGDDDGTENRCCYCAAHQKRTVATTPPPVGPAEGAIVRYFCFSCVSPRDGSTMNT